MLTIRAAAQLLARADCLSALRPLARAIGFHSFATVDTALGRSLGLAPFVTAASIADGPGALRLLMAELAPPHDGLHALDMRERTRRVATALARSSPERLWCVITIAQSGSSAADGPAPPTLCLAAVSHGRYGVRLAALRVDRHRVLDSDAETVRALASVTEQDDLLRHARFTDVLQRDAIGHRFYRALEQAVGTLADSLAPERAQRHGATAPTVAQRREMALQCTSRCLFLAFLEARGWLDGRRDFLLHHTVARLEDGGRLHDRLLRPLFFGTLNTPRQRRAATARTFGAVPFLNGGLFAPAPLERRFRHWHFSDDAVTALVVSVIDRYRFTAHEDSAQWSEAAVDPEMLGRAFEGLMADNERRRSGSYYTPPALVAQTVHEALGVLLPEGERLVEALAATADGTTSCDAVAAIGLDPHEQSAVRARIDELRIIDPACGSGAFLVHMLETLDRLLALLGDERDSHTRRRDLLTRSIFGVDRQPMAVWLCELRLWLSVIIECPADHPDRIPPLPNLDHHIRVGDSLAGGGFRYAPASARALTRLRERYARASGARKQQLADTLDREERTRAVGELGRRREAMQHERRALLTAVRGRDLFGERRRLQRAERTRLEALRQQVRALQHESNRLRLGAALPFRFAAMFADVASRGGFSLVIGNPPWVRPHALPIAEREWLRREFRVMRAAAWKEGAARAGAGTGFAAQADLSAAFVERGVQLLRPSGVLAFLVPAKLWRTLSGGGVRRLLLEDMELCALRDWSDAPALFDAATYPSLVVARRPASPTGSRDGAPERRRTSPAVRCSVSRRRTVHFERPVTGLPLQGDPDAPWVLLPPSAHAAFDALCHAGPALARTSLGRPLLGVKCGYNAAFLVHAEEHDDLEATVTALSGPPRQAVIERALLRPALRGDGIVIGEPVLPSLARDLRVVWTHDANGQPLRTLPPATARWLAQWRPRLQSRRDSRHAQPWWTLFRTEAARFDVPRLVWADIARRMRCTVLPAGDPTVPLNSCYVMRLPTLHDAHALHALLVSTVANAWLGVLAEPARGGFRRYLGWTVAALPTPRDWPRAVRLLEPLGRALADAQRDGAATDTLIAAIETAVMQAYQLSPSLLSPLLEWSRHE